MRHLSTSVTGLLLLTACVTVSKSVLSTRYTPYPVPKEEVQVFFADDSIPEHDRVAILHGEGDETLTNESQMIDKFRQEAGKLGANAIVLGQIKDPSTGAKVVSALFGTSAERKGQAIAIYVPSLDKRNRNP